MSSAWEQIVTVLQRIGEVFPHLPLALFALGTVALLWLLRRSLLNTRYDGRRELACFRTRSNKAHADIDQISAREWHIKHHAALKFNRTCAVLTEEQRSLLDQLGALQAKAGQN